MLYSDWLMLYNICMCSNRTRDRVSVCDVKKFLKTRAGPRLSVAVWLALHACRGVAAIERKLVDVKSSGAIVSVIHVSNGAKWRW